MALRRPIGGPSGVEIHETLRRRLRVLSFAGDLDLWGAPDIAARIEDAVADPNHGLVLDLTACEFIDSAGLQQLVKAARLSNGTPESSVTIVCDPNGAVSRTLRLTGLWDVLDVRPSLG